MVMKDSTANSTLGCESRLNIPSTSPKKVRKAELTVPSEAAASFMAEDIRWTRSWVLWRVKSSEGQER